MDTLAEWSRRRPAKPMGSPRVGSNPTGVDFKSASVSDLEGSRWSFYLERVGWIWKEKKRTRRLRHYCRTRCLVSGQFGRVV